MTDDIMSATLVNIDGTPLTLENLIDAARKLLVANGFVVHKAKSWRQLIERVRVAEVMERHAEEYRESTQRWAETTLHNEIRDLQARCTFLYGEARAKGATADELSGGWAPAGINLPTERSTTVKCPECDTHPYLIKEVGKGPYAYVCAEHGVVNITPRRPWGLEVVPDA